MVITVNLNPNQDRLIKVNGFTYGGMNRMAEKKDDLTSKGINTSTVLARLGVETLCTGFMYEDNRAHMVGKLEKDGILHDYVWQPGAMRMNLKLLDEKNGVITEINDKGVPAGEEQLSAVRQKIFNNAKENDVIVTIGSMPPGCPKEFFAGIIEEANQKGLRCVLDAEGEILKKGVAAKPFFVKINRFELETLSGKSMESESELVKESQKVIESGVKLLAVSLGAQGAIITDGKTTLKAAGMQVAAKSATGAGDSMLAGILAGVLQSKPLEEMLRMGTAAATATAMCEGTELTPPALFKELYPKVSISRLA